MIEFFGTPAGIALLCVLIAAALIFLIEVNYKAFAKLALDFIIALVSIIILSPLLAVCAMLSKLRDGEKVFKGTPYLGYKGKIIFIYEFSCINNRLKYLARLFNVLTGSLAIVGVKPLPASDGALISDEDWQRFNARPGLICHMRVTGFDDAKYEDMFALDTRYADRRQMYYDLYILVWNAVLAVRGERNRMGECAEGSYLNALTASGEITPEQAAKACEYAEEAVMGRERRRQFHREKSSYNKR